MQIFVDKDRIKKRQQVIKQSSSDPQVARRLLESAGIITSNGNISKVYRITTHR